MGRRVIVTGGAGFIGSHLCEALLERGYEVVALDNFVTGRKENLAACLEHRGFSFFEWDVSEPLPTPQRERWVTPDLVGVLHFACPASPVDFDRIPFEILKVDSYGTFHAVDWARSTGARLLLASTSEVYGDPLEHPQQETYWGNVNTLGPRACYDETKRFAEAVVSTAQRIPVDGKTLNAGIVRIFNTYGPRMRPDDGRVVPELCMRALEGRALTVHGKGAQTRSFCYVSDLVAGIVKLFESQEQRPVNLGNPDEKTILEFASLVRQFAGGTVAIEHLPEREDDPKRRCPDITRARTVLNWQPTVRLEDGLRRTWEYFRAHRAGA